MPLDTKKWNKRKIYKAEDIYWFDEHRGQWRSFNLTRTEVQTSVLITNLMKRWYERTG